MTDLPHITVATVVERDGRFLMVREVSKEPEVDLGGDARNGALDAAPSGGHLVYNQPAGHLEPGESLLEAARRETMEETGWHVEITGLVGIYQYHAEANGTEYLRHCFAGHVIRQDDELGIDPDIESVHWLTANEIKDLRDKARSPLVWQAIEDYLSGTLWSLELFKPRLR